MPRAKKATAPIAADAVSRNRAKEALAWFRAAVKIALKHVAEERVTKRKALEALRRRYTGLCDAYLRVDGTTYEAWCELVKPEWDEVVAAAADDAVWDRLVETYERRNHAD